MMGQAPLRGLSAQEVAERAAQGAVNVDAGVKTRSVGQIVRENTLTLFNAINVVLAAFVLFTGSYKNMLFMLVIVCNTAIGIAQEVRSKRTTDRLSIVTSSKARVLRGSEQVELALDELVRDDVIELRRGDQIPADSVVVQGGCDVDESLLTGESAAVRKRVGDELMSGSFVSVGTVWARVAHVGAENYAAQISAEAKKHKAVNSEIMNSLNGIIKFVSFVLFPLGALLFARQLFGGDDAGLEGAILSSVAALVGMIPEGLILLTSTVLAVAVVRLSRSRVLVQQLYCIETLARVDTLCLDKTGTITTGHMELGHIEALPGADAAYAQRVFASLAAADEDPNETAQAIAAHFAQGGPELLEPARFIPFSSEKKWSGATFANGESYVMGAGQFILKEAFSQVAQRSAALAGDARVLLLARVEGFDEEGGAMGEPVPIGFASIDDELRATARRTIAYFEEQDVSVKVISGDDPRTVSGIAAKVGVPNAEAYVDASTLADDAACADAIERYSVFGRVKPEQKKAFVVALQAKGHIVAMTGDGVNDTLALKQADCSVAMAAGSDAARNVAQLVLVDNDFAAMPKVVAEGRRSINNLQRSASLFLVKTLLSMSLALLFILLPWQYPFQPIQMTLISAFTIGIPSFVLALEPNRERVKGSFLSYVVVHAVPGALCALLMVVAANVLGHLVLGLAYSQVSTLCVLLTAWVGVQLIVKLSLPLTPLRAALLAVVAGGTVLGATLFRRLFGIEPFTFEMALFFVAAAAVAAVLFHVLYRRFDAWHAARLARSAEPLFAFSGGSRRR